MKGQDLHGFEFVKPDRLGVLPRERNWLVDKYGANAEAKLRHWTADIPAWLHLRGRADGRRVGMHCHQRNARDGMKLLVTGRGGATGSWQKRGEELGRAIGATVEPNANSVKGYDLAVVVKRPRADLLKRLRTRGVPVVWDVVDAWPQPEGNLWNREQCMAWLRTKVETVRPIAIVAATKAMAKDCEEFGVSVFHLPHHARPGINRNPVRDRVAVLGYDGWEQYLGRWKTVLERECEQRRWRFVVNPRHLADLDVVVALREQAGYAVRFWKSNVKLANAQGSGTPCILNREQGYLETSCGAECWADTDDELRNGLDMLGASYDLRRALSEQLLMVAPSLPAVAEGYKAWLTTLLVLRS